MMEECTWFLHADNEDSYHKCANTQADLSPFGSYVSRYVFTRFGYTAYHYKNMTIQIY